MALFERGDDERECEREHERLRGSRSVWMKRRSDEATNERV